MSYHDVPPFPMDEVCPRCEHTPVTSYDLCDECKAETQAHDVAGFETVGEAMDSGFFVMALGRDAQAIGARYGSDLPVLLIEVDATHPTVYDATSKAAGAPLRRLA